MAISAYEVEKGAYGVLNARESLNTYLKNRPYLMDSISRDAAKLSEIYKDLDNNINYFDSLNQLYNERKELQERLEMKYKFEKFEKINLNKRMVDEQIQHNEKIKKREDLPFPLRQIANTLFPL